MIRLKILGFDTYGVFDKTSLPLGKGLTIVVGPNEAGKSTALNALADLLWGVPLRHWLRDLTPRPALRLSAEWEDLSVTGGLTDGASSRVVRTGRGLHSGEDVVQVVENPWGPDGEDQRRHWLTAFGLSHQTLREGGRQVFAGGGDLAELVFTARQGQSVHDLLAAIDRRADALFKDHKNSKNVRVRVALEEFQRQRLALDESMVRATQVVDAEAEVADLKRRSGEAAELETKAQREVTRLAEHARCLDTAHRLLRARRDIATIQGSGTALGEGDVLAYDKARGDLLDVEREQTPVIEQLQAWTTERDSLTVDDAVLAHGERIESLRTQAEARAGDRERAAAGRREAADQDRLAGRELEALLGRPVAAEATGAVLRSLIVPADRVAQLDAAAERHAARVGDHRTQVAGVEQARADLELLGQGTDLPDRETLAPLAADVRALKAVASPLVGLRSARDAAIEARRRRRQAMLGAGAVDPEAEPAAVPTENALLEAIERLENADAEAARATERLREAESALDTSRQELRGAETAQVIAPENLGQARAERDSLWSDISRAWVEGRDPDGGDPADLVATYSQRVQRADAVADRLLDQATFDAQLTQLQRRVAELEAEIAEREAAHHQAVADREREQAAWQALWSALGVAVPAIARAQVVRQALLTARAAVTDEATARDTVAALEPEVSQWATRMAGHLADLRSATPAGAQAPGLGGDDIASLDHQLAAAETLIDEVDQARERQERRRSAQQSLTRAQSKLARLEQDLADWDTQWRDLISAAELPEIIDPVGWAVRRDRVDAARKAWEQAEQLRRTAATAALAWDTFEASVAELSAVHGHAGASEQTLDGLWARLSTSRADQKTHRDRSDSIAAATKRLGELSGRQDAARAVLDELGRRWSLSGDDDLAQAADRRRRLTEATADQKDLLAQLRTAADPGRDVDLLLGDLAEVDHADLQVRAAQADEELQRAQTNRSATAQEFGAADEKFAHLQRRGDAAELHALTQEKLAEVSELAEEYATLHVQRLVLREVLETHAARHTSPLLETAGRLLERLTGGRWVALQAEDDGAGTRSLRVIRRDGEPQPPTALSEGTADQVFLALRLAGIAHLQSERRLDGRTPLPVVLDDVLMAFDDERARNALLVLADGASDATSPMQVIVFTHHEHLASLAEALGRDDIQVDRLVPQELSLSHLDADELRASAARASGALAAAARAAGGRLGATAATSSRPATTVLTRSDHDADPATVRAWAKANDIEVADRGRLPAELVTRYLAATQG